MKHEISIRHSADIASEVHEHGAGPDALFFDDPWAGKSVSNVRAAASCEIDSWAAWRQGRLEQTGADESRVGRQDTETCRAVRDEAGESYGCGRIVVDVLANEAFRVLHLALVDAVGDLPKVGGVEPIVTGEHEMSDDAADGERRCSEDIEADDHDVDCDISSYINGHAVALQRFMKEWERTEDSMRLEAEHLAMVDEQCEDGWWNESLERAEQLVSFASMFSDARSDSVDCVSITSRVCEHLDYLDADDVSAIVDDKITMSGFSRGSMAPTGAWVLMLGLTRSGATDPMCGDHCLES